MLPTTEAPFPFYTDINGDALDEGSIYFGTPNANPQTSPIPVYWDDASTQPAAQPVLTIAGYAVRAGTPANTFINGPYSISVYDKKGRLIYYAPDSSDFSNYQKLIDDGADLIGYTAPGGVRRTIGEKLDDEVSVKDYGAVGDGVTDDTAAILAASVASKNIFFPAGTYLYSTLTFAGTVQMRGAGKFATVLKTSTLTVDAITFSANGSGIRDIGFDASANRTAGAYINTNGSRYIFFRDLHFTKYFIGIDADNFSSGVDIDGISALDGTPSGVSPNGALIRVGNTNYTGPVNISDVVADVNVPANQPSAGIVIKYGDVVSLKGVLIIHHGIPLDITPTAGQTASLISVTASCFDTSSGQGVRLFPAVGGSVYRNAFTGCTMSANSGDGLQINGINGAVQGVLLSDCNFTANTQIGANIVGSGAKDIYFSNCASAGNTLNGLQITSSPQNITWNGGAIGAYGGIGGNVQNGVAVDSSIANVTVALTNLEGNGFGRISDPGNKIQQIGNTPFAWESYTSAISASSGTITTSSAIAAYKRVGKVVHVRIRITITTNGTGAGTLFATAPSVAGADCCIVGRGTAVNPHTCTGTITTGGNTFSILKYDGTYPGVDGEVIFMTGCYEEA